VRNNWGEISAWEEARKEEEGDPSHSVHARAFLGKKEPSIAKRQQEGIITEGYQENKKGMVVGGNCYRVSMEG